MKAGRPEEALTCFDKATLKKPEFYYGWVFRAIALYENHDLDDSRRYLSLADKLAVHAKQSIIAERITQDPDLHTTAIEFIDRQRQSALRRLARTFRGFAERILKFARGAIQEVPRQEEKVKLSMTLELDIVAQTNYVLGQDYLNAKEYQAAVERFDIALQRQPEYLLPLCAKGIALARCGDSAGARRMVESIQPLLTADIPLQLRALTEYFIASISGLLGDAQMATLHLDQAIGAEPQLKLVARGNPDFDPVKNDKGFQQMTA